MKTIVSLLFVFSLFILPSKSWGEDFSVFSQTLYPQLQNRCGSCHESKQSPYFASSDLNTAYKAAFKRVTPENPLLSKLWIRSQNLHCEDASKCGSADPLFLTQLKDWIAKDTLFQQPQTNWDWSSTTQTLTLDLQKNDHFDFEIQPDLKIQFDGVFIGQGLYYFKNFKIQNSGKPWVVEKINFQFTDRLTPKAPYLEFVKGLIPVTQTPVLLAQQPAFMIEVNTSATLPQFKIQIKSLSPAQPNDETLYSSILKSEIHIEPKAIAVKAGSSRTCVLFENFKVKCFGNNANGELGHHWREFLTGNLSWGDSVFEVNDSIPFLNLPSLSKESFLSSGIEGQSHLCLMTRGLLCFGSNQFGQLGVENLPANATQNPQMELEQFPHVMIESTLNASADFPLEIKKVTSGQAFNCILFSNQRVKCFGSNFLGELGLGDKKPRGSLPQTMEQALPYLNNENLKITKITSGANHTCVVIENLLAESKEEVRCFGTNRYGELGSDIKGSFGDEPTETLENAPIVPLSQKEGRIVEFVSGASHNCVLFENHKVQCFGKNTYGQLGVGDNKDRNLKSNDPPAFLQIPSEEKMIKIAAGGQNTCVLTQNHKMYCFGRNDSGQLGIGNLNNRGTLPSEVGEFAQSVTLPSSDSIEEISVGSNHICVLIEGGWVKCFGSNAYGQLGLGDTLSVGKNPVDLQNLSPALLGQKRIP